METSESNSWLRMESGSSGPTWVTRSPTCRSRRVSVIVIVPAEGPLGGHEALEFRDGLCLDLANALGGDLILGR